MKTLKNIVLSGLMLVSLSSCNFLDKEPHTLTIETYFNTANELQTFLTGVYSPIMNEVFYGNWYPLYDTGGDDLTFYQRSSPATCMMCANTNSSDMYLTQLWRILYDGINRANILLENADRNSSIDAATRNQVKAEALFLRSFYYFNLVQGWGDVPMRLKAVDTPVNLDLARTPKQAVYEQIIKDIRSAIPNLPAVSAGTPYNGHVTQSAAKSILARIYMFRAGENYRDAAVGNALTNSADSIKAYFTHARDIALEVKNSGLHGLVPYYSRIFIDLSQDKYNSTGVAESIWEAEEAGNRSTAEQAAGRIGNVIGFGSTNDYSTVATIQNLSGKANPGYSYKFAYASLKLFQMYESEGDTARGNWNITNYEYVYASTAPKQVTGLQFFYGKLPAGVTSIDGLPCTQVSQSSSATNQTRCCAKYRREYELVIPKNKNYTPINFPIMRYSDVLLMIAEADNELASTPSDLAYECIDAVRSRAHLTKLKGTGLTTDQFRDAIKKERAMELCFEATRRWDLIRWGDYYNNMTNMSTYVNQSGWNSNMKYAASYYKIPATYNYFPIPDWEISLNKAIKSNNPGW
jgi:hypothetical protein